MSLQSQEQVQVKKRIILPPKNSNQQDKGGREGTEGAGAGVLRPQSPRMAPFSLPQKQVCFKGLGFERGSYYTPNKTLTIGNQTFHEGEILEVLGSRKFGPMAALEVIFRNNTTGVKKFWILHHDRHNYWQDDFTRLS
jgi:hypothetical protein